MRTMGFICILALIAVAFEVYSDAAMTRSDIPTTARDPLVVGYHP
jgi:hypothetical protein